MTFKNLIPHLDILSAIEELGYTSPTPIQSQAIPQVIAGLDIRASAQTGTGKTAAFLLPALLRLATPSEIPGTGPRILILVPTRELAMQVAAEAKKFSKNLAKTKTVCIYGGAPYPVQNKELARPYEILVATPGRLIDHMERGKINFSRIEMLILDEADRMLDMGFISDVEQIAEETPKTRQTLLFSATMKGSVLNLSRRLLNNPIEITVEAEHASHDNIEQRLYNVDNLDHKYRILDSLLKDTDVHQVIVFTSTKRQADLLADKLSDNDQAASVMHGDMRQRQRSQTIAMMRQEKIRILVATDVAARGIDVPTISHVINFDLPGSVEDYVHRIGRTGRAGAKGISISFVANRDLQFIKRIERFTGQKIAVEVIVGMEPRSKSSGRSDMDSRDSRPSRSPRSDSDRPARDSFHADGDRPRRPFQADGDRPRRSFNSDGDSPRRPFQADGDRPRRPFQADGDRPRRPFQADGDRPRRSFNSDGDSPRRPFQADGDRPRRPFQADGDRPRRPFQADGDRPRRPFQADGDRPRRPFQADGDRPRRPFQADGEFLPRQPSSDQDPAPRPYARPEKKKFGSKPKFRPKY